MPAVHARAVLAAGLLCAWETAGAQSDDEQPAFRGVVLEHLARYPALEMQDLYKLAHQAAMGTEHALTDTAAARRWLEQELTQLGPGPPGPMIERITPDSELVRVNLRPFTREGGSTDALLAAFVRTANEYPGSTVKLAIYWSHLEAMAESGEIRFPREELAAYFAGKRREGFPAVHHSSTYAESYRPAYRVVRYEFLIGKPTSY